MPNPYGWGQNEPQIKPKDQGGDTISTFAAKIKNAITSLFNTLNSYPWSNATQTAAGYMSAEDKAALDGVPTTYLPLAGGALTGVTTSPTPATNDNSIKIATTAFVNNLCTEIYKDLGDNYVMNLSDFDKLNVMYRINSFKSTPSTNCPPSGYNNGDLNVIAFRGGNYVVLIGSSPRNPALYIGRFWAGNFMGWSVIARTATSEAS